MDKNSFKCHKCPKLFTLEKSMIKHVTLKHRGDEEKYPLTCELCEKSYSDVYGLRRHVSAVHEKLRPFECSKCSKTFSENTKLKIHFAT